MTGPSNPEAAGRQRFTTPAVVVGLDLNGLGTVRSLGSAAVPVLAVDTDLTKPEAATRFALKRRFRTLSGPGLIEELVALRSEFAEAPVLLLTQEASVATVSAARDQLLGSYRFTMPDVPLMEALMDKGCFQAMAERHGCPVPRAMLISDPGSLNGLAVLRFPCVVKPAKKLSGTQFAKAYKIDDQDQLAHVAPGFGYEGVELIAQEWIEGADSDIYFCLQYRPRNGGSISFVGRKICQWPRHVGGTASCIPAPEAEEALTALTDRFFSAVGFTGIGSMEYKRDARDGAFYMVEPTVGRSDYQEEIATLNGTNIPLALYCAELGLPLPPQSKRPRPRAWRDPFAYAKARSAGAPDPTPKLSPRIVVCDAYWRPDDPKPYVALLTRRMKSRLSVPVLRHPGDAASPIARAKQTVKSTIQRLRLPTQARRVLRQDHTGVGADAGARRAIEEAVAWLGRAQDHSLSNDGGVARHFSLVTGWSHSYPETTGYIVPTMIAHANETGSAESMARARRMLDWLVAIQFPEGGFQGGMIGQEPRVPVTFNTGQILIGLAAGAVLEPRYRESMRRAADWLVRTQDRDGCWRKHPTPFAEPGDKAYETHVALGLMHAAAVDPDRGYLEVALRQVDWALGRQTPNGWIADCCLSDPDRPLTHTLGYALRGIIGAYHCSGNEIYLQAACRTADGVMSALDKNGRLPGRLDREWGAAADWVCLTGSSQMAECWLLLHRATGRDDYRRAGLAANAFVRRTMSMNGPADIRGGVKGSYPVDGGYGTWQYLNWACKFTIDANREELKLASATR